MTNPRTIARPPTARSEPGAECSRNGGSTSRPSVKVLRWGDPEPPASSVCLV